MPSAAAAGSSHRSRRMSKQWKPYAWVRSHVASPVNRAVRKPDAVRNQRVASKIAGSCARSQASLGVMYAASSGLATRSMSRSASGPRPERRRLVLCAPVEPGHRRRQRPEGVVHGHQRPADAVDGDVQRRPGRGTPLAARTSATVPHSASHHRSGSISARTASGRSRSYVAVASATGTPPASQSAVFVLEVPWSTVTMYTIARVRSRWRPGRRS